MRQLGVSEKFAQRLVKKVGSLLYDLEHGKETVQINTLLLLSKERKIPKRFYQNGRIKCKVSNFLYDLVDDSGAHIVKTEIEINDGAAEHCQPSTLSTCDSDYRFVVFFSKIKNNQFECKIVNYTKHGDHDDFYLKTRFGKVLNINFCIDNGNVSFVKMRTYHAN